MISARHFGRRRLVEQHTEAEDEESGEKQGEVGGVVEEGRRGEV